MAMQHVLIALEDFPANVTLASWAMEQAVKVRLEVHLSFIIVTFMFVSLDIDECSSSSLNDCDINAECTDTIGSFECNCIVGFSGDGTNCSGTINYIMLSHNFRKK